jgi:hypothetical protein
MCKALNYCLLHVRTCSSSPVIAGDWLENRLFAKTVALVAMFDKAHSLTLAALINDISESSELI